MNLNPLQKQLEVLNSPSFRNPCTTNISEGTVPEHFVQFYETDEFLIQCVSEYFSFGLRKRDGAIVIATPEHISALENNLIDAGFDLSAIKGNGQFVPLDAGDTLAQFMLGDLPDPGLFEEVVGGVVSRAGKGRPALRAFGEMVALLWGAGNREGAIRLEELWNDLGRKHTFSLFCAYPMAGLGGSHNSQPMLQVCKAHTRVIPAESYTANTVEDHYRQIAILQQKSCSLEAEVAHRKECEKALARRERELSSFLENATEGIHQVAADGKILWANRAEMELLGYTAEEYIGRHISEFHADQGVIASMLQRLGRGENLYDLDARLKHKDGSLRFVSINSSAYLEDGKLVHTRCFTRDITDRKRSAEILEQTVTERTAQLREMVAELESFSDSVSHDLRSPLRAMQGYAETLLLDHGSKLDPEGADCLERIQKSANRLELLIRDLLAYSKIAKSQIEIRPVPLGPFR